MSLPKGEGGRVGHEARAEQKEVKELPSSEALAIFNFDTKTWEASTHELDPSIYMERGRRLFEAIHKRYPGAFLDESRVERKRRNNCDEVVLILEHDSQLPLTMDGFIEVPIVRAYHVPRYTAELEEDPAGGYRDCKCSVIIVAGKDMHLTPGFYEEGDRERLIEKLPKGWRYEQGKGMYVSVYDAENNKVGSISEGLSFWASGDTSNAGINLAQHNLFSEERWMAKFNCEASISETVNHPQELDIRWFALARAVSALKERILREGTTNHRIDLEESRDRYESELRERYVVRYDKGDKHFLRVAADVWKKFDTTEDNKSSSGASHYSILDPADTYGVVESPANYSRNEAFPGRQLGTGVDAKRSDAPKNREEATAIVERRGYLIDQLNKLLNDSGVQQRHADRLDAMRTILTYETVLHNYYREAVGSADLEDLPHFGLNPDYPFSQLISLLERDPEAEARKVKEEKEEQERKWQAKQAAMHRLREDREARELRVTIEWEAVEKRLTDARIELDALESIIELLQQFGPQKVANERKLRHVTTVTARSISGKKESVDKGLEGGSDYIDRASTAAHQAELFISDAYRFIGEVVFGSGSREEKVARGEQALERFEELLSVLDDTLPDFLTTNEIHESDIHRDELYYRLYREMVLQGNMVDEDWLEQNIFSYIRS